MMNNGGPYKHMEKFSGYPQGVRPLRIAEADDNIPPIFQTATCEHGVNVGDDCAACEGGTPEQYEPEPPIDFEMKSQKPKTGLWNDEVKLVDTIQERIEAGRLEYGEWVAANEGRDLLKEASEELMDYLVYRAMLKLKEKVVK